MTLLQFNILTCESWPILSARFHHTSIAKLLSNKMRNNNYAYITYNAYFDKKGRHGAIKY